MDRKRTEAMVIPLPELLAKIDEVTATAVRSLAIGMVRAGQVRPDHKAKYDPNWWAAMEQVANAQEAMRPDWNAMEHLTHSIGLLDATRKHVAMHLALMETEKPEGRV